MASVVYFVECSATGRIKIGVTEDVTRRLAQLNNMNCAPVRLVGAVTGSVSVERHLHERFSATRLHGEWFTSSPELWSVIESANVGQLALNVIEVPRRLPADCWLDLLTEVQKKLEAISKHCGSHQIKTRIRFAANATGLSYWRTFDLWYVKARQISPTEVQAINDAYADHELQTAGDD